MANVLTIDDDANVRRLLNKGLSLLGHKVLEAEDGRAGFRTAYCRKVDIILLDITMPGISGLELLRKLKKTFRTSHIPVLMLTGYDDDDMKDQALYEYSEGYILKSTGVREINSKINTVLKNRPVLANSWPTMLRR